MIHVLEHPQFPVGPLGVDGGLERPGQLLDGDFEALSVLQHCLGVCGAADLWERLRMCSSRMSDLHTTEINLFTWHCTSCSCRAHTCSVGSRFYHFIFIHNAHLTVCARPDGGEVLVTVRHLPHRLVQLKLVKSLRRARHGDNQEELVVWSCVLLRPICEQGVLMQSPPPLY